MLRHWKLIGAMAVFSLAGAWLPATSAWAEYHDSGLYTSATVLSFSAVQGGVAPQTQSFAVSAARTMYFTASVSTASGRNWLAISPSGSLHTNQTIKVSVNQGSLPAGTYRGSIRLTAGTHETRSSTRTVAVTLVVSSAAAQLTASPASLSFNAVAGGAAPGPQAVSVTASSPVAFTASVSTVSGGNWLGITPLGSLTTNQTLNASVNPSGLAAGSYQGTIVLKTASASQSVGVSLTVVNPTVTLNASPQSLSFNAVAGGAAPAPQAALISASSPTNFTASVSTASGGNWLSIAPSGSLTTNQTLTASVNPFGLAAGSYAGKILLSSSGGSTSVSVNLAVNDAASTTTVMPSSMAFSAMTSGVAPPAQTVSVTASSSMSFTASASTHSGGNWLAVTPTSGFTSKNLSVVVNPGTLAAGTYQGAISIVSGGASQTAPVQLVIFGSGGSTVKTNTGYKAIAWNDLGMHCMDGKDYSIFGVLPPYNTIHVHLIDSAGNLVKSPAGYALSYQAIANPLTGGITTTAAPKTNFWQYAAALGFGNLAPDMGLAGYAMPGASNTPQNMGFTATDNTWTAVGIPMMPYEDAAAPPYQPNYLPMMRVTARNSSGQVLATTDIVTPTSDEMTCKTCHASVSGSSAAMPASGWVNNPDAAKDAKLNILKKHDDRFASSSLFQPAMSAAGYTASSLYGETAIKPILCAACHSSNALGLSGYPGIESLTTAVHGMHSNAIDPATNQTLNSGTTRNACYSCHPGPNTQCLRGAMATLQTSTGGNAIDCQSCHGTMATVANSARKGWLNEPSCQSCHIGTAVTASGGPLAYTSVYSSGTTVRTTTDATFATNPNTPSSGLSLYRFSTGHGGLQCEACHGSTHAEYTTGAANDNVQSTNLQGHVGVIAECVSCHGTNPSTTTGGPHGLHPIGAAWVSKHPQVANANGPTQCQACHGTDYRGTILSKTMADRSMAGRSFPAGTVIGCYSCHNGPNGD